jgi:hypothetical protein
MKRKSLLLVTLNMLFVYLSFAQDFQWAYTASLPLRSHTVAIKESPNKHYCLAVYTDSATYRKSTLFCNNSSQQLLWSKSFSGYVTISDVEVASDNSIIVVGSFKDSILVGPNWLYANPGFEEGFIVKYDENGSLQWSNLLNPFSDSFIPTDLYIANDTLFYLTARHDGASASFCSFHRLNSNGVIDKSEVGGNIDVRSFTNIVTDTNGNVYLSGTCGSSAVFDSLHADINFSYQNYLVKYDSDFNAQWILCKQYITFDDNNKLNCVGNNLYWVFDDFSNLSGDTVKILKVNFSGQILASQNGQVSTAFFPGVAFDMDSQGNSILIEEAFVRLFITRFDSAFNVIWSDTVLTGASGFAQEIGLSCYDSCFYLSSLYYSDTLALGNLTIMNPNTTQNSPSDLFVTRWGYPAITSVAQIQNSNNLKIFPNPVDDKLQFNLNGEMAAYDLQIVDISGRVVFWKQNMADKFLHVASLSPGLYLLKLKRNEAVFTGTFVKN